MDIDNLATGSVKIGDLVYGSLRYLEGRGWKFIPAISGRTTSRKWHRHAKDALPPYVKKACREHNSRAAVLRIIESRPDPRRAL